MPKVSGEHWFETSVVRDMARGLRSAGLWTNALGDGVAFLRSKIKALERFSTPEMVPELRIKRPLATWDDCRRVLLAITLSRAVTFSDIPAPVAKCLDLAVVLHRWESEGKPIPSNIRAMMHGAIAVEWADGKSLIL